jgi:hypothetical protein
VILLYTEPALRICLLEQKKNLTPKEALRVIKVLHKVDRLLQRCLPTGWPPKKIKTLWRAGYSHLVPRPWKELIILKLYDSANIGTKMLLNPLLKQTMVKSGFLLVVLFPLSSVLLAGEQETTTTTTTAQPLSAIWNTD